MPKKTTRTSARTRVLKKLPTARDRTEKPRLWHDGSLLRRLYKEEGKSQGEIARQLGCSLVTINKAFKAAGIKASRGRRSRAVLVAGSRKPTKVKEAATSLPQTYRNAPLVSRSALDQVLDQLGSALGRLSPTARASLKKDLHKLVDKL